MEFQCYINVNFHVFIGHFFYFIIEDDAYFISPFFDWMLFVFSY